MAGETGSHDRTGARSALQANRATKRAATAAAIETCALRLFAEQGFDETTVPQIARAAGVSRATVFRYFPAKEDIVFARHPREVEALRSAIRAHPEAGTDRDEMIAALEAFVEFLERDAEHLALRVAVLDTHPQLASRALADRAEFAEAIAEELSGGEDPDLRVHVLASAVMAALVLALRVWRESGAGDDLRPLLVEALSTISFVEASAAPSG